MPQQMVQLMKRPFARLTHMSNTLQRIESRLGVAAGAAVMQRLAEAAQERARRETDRADRTGFLFTKVRSFETLEPVGARFDTRSIIKRDFFDMQLDHPRGVWDRIAVEVILVHEHTYTSVAICSLENPGRALLFPSFRHGDVVLDKKACTPTALELVCPCPCAWPRTLRLMSSEERKLARWRDVLEAIFPREVAPSQMSFECDDLGISTPSNGMGHLVTPPPSTSLSRSQMISRLSVGPVTGSLVEQLKDYLTPEDTIEIDSDVKRAGGSRMDETPSRQTEPPASVGALLISPSPSPEQAEREALEARRNEQRKLASELAQTPSRNGGAQTADASATPLAERLKKAQVVRRQIQKDMMARERQSQRFRQSTTDEHPAASPSMLGFGALSSERKLPSSPLPVSTSITSIREVAEPVTPAIGVDVDAAATDETEVQQEPETEVTESVETVEEAVPEAVAVAIPQVETAETLTQKPAEPADPEEQQQQPLAAETSVTRQPSRKRPDSVVSTASRKRPQRLNLSRPQSQHSPALSATTESQYPPPPPTGPPQVPLPSPSMASLPQTSGRTTTQFVELTASDSNGDLPTTGSSTLDFDIETPSLDAHRPLLGSESPQSASTGGDAERTRKLVGQQRRATASQFKVARRPVVSMFVTPADRDTSLQVPRSQSDQDNKLPQSRSMNSILTTDSEFPSRTNSPARGAFMSPRPSPCPAPGVSAYATTPMVTNLEDDSSRGRRSKRTGGSSANPSKFVKKISGGFGGLRNMMKRSHKSPKMEFEMVTTPRVLDSATMATPNMNAPSTGRLSSMASPAVTVGTGELMQTPESKILARMPSPEPSEIRRSNGTMSPPVPVSIFAGAKDVSATDDASASKEQQQKATDKDLKPIVEERRPEPERPPMAPRDSMVSASSVTSDSEYVSAVELPTPTDGAPESPIYSRPSTPVKEMALNPMTPDTVRLPPSPPAQDSESIDEQKPMPAGPPPPPPPVLAVCDESHNVTVETGNSCSISIRSASRSVGSTSSRSIKASASYQSLRESVSSQSFKETAPLRPLKASASSHSLRESASSRSLVSTTSYQSVESAKRPERAQAQAQDSPVPSTPSTPTSSSSVLTIFRGTGWVSSWEQYRWVPLSEKELPLSITLGSDGGSLFIAAASSHLHREVSLAPNQTQVRADTPHDVHVKDGELNLMIRIRSASTARQFTSAIASTRLDLKNQPLIYQRNGRFTPSLNDTDSSLGSISSSATDTSSTRDLTSTPPQSFRGIRLPPRLGTGRDGRATPPQRAPPALPSVAESAGELMLLNDLRCKLLEKDLDGAFVDGPIGKLCIYTAVGSEFKTVVLKDTHPGATQPLLLERNMPPQAFKRHGRVGISIGLATTEANDIVRFLLQFRGEKEARHVYDLLTAH